MKTYENARKRTKTVRKRTKRNKSNDNNTKAYENERKRTKTYKQRIKHAWNHVERRNLTNLKHVKSNKDYIEQH